MNCCMIGVDLGVTSKHVACVSNGEGKPSKKTVSFSLTQEELDRLCAKAKEEAGGKSVHFICEATAMSWFPLALYAHKEGYSISKIKSQSMSSLRRFSQRYRKSDSLDAKTLVRALLVDVESVREIQLADAETFALKRACRQTDKFIRGCTQIKHRILSFCSWVMPEIKESFDDPFSEMARSFYWHFTDPFKAKRAGIEGMRKKLEKEAGKKIEDSVLQEIYQKVLVNCEFFQNTEEYLSFEYLTEEMRLNLESLKAMEKLKDKAAKRVKPLYKKVHSEGIVESLPGVGERIGPALLGEIENVSRFSSQSNYRSFIGIVPKQDDSGQTVKKGLRMTHEGSSRLRYLYYQASNTARQWDPQLAKIYYEGMVHKGKSHQRALIPVMAALANRTLAILRKGQPYEFRDTEGHAISKKEARYLIKSYYTVPKEIRKRTTRKREERERHSSKFRKRQPKAPHKLVQEHLSRR